jgi:hypothetical protein
LNFVAVLLGLFSTASAQDPIVGEVVVVGFIFGTIGAWILGLLVSFLWRRVPKERLLEQKRS